MKAFSIRQPYAFAVTYGFKPVENRDWKPTNPALRFRGRVLIHAGLREEKDDVDGVIRQIADQTGKSYTLIAGGYRNARALGAIVGAAVVSDVVTEMDIPWFYGPYGLVMTDAKWCVPLSCPGMLGFFEPPKQVCADAHLIFQGCPPYENWA